VNARRLLPLGLGITALLVVAGVASHGRPLAGGRGRGPTAGFFDYVATTLAIAAALMVAFVGYIVLSQRRTAGGPPRRGRWHLVSVLIMLAASALISWLILSSGFIQRYKNVTQHLQLNPGAGRPPNAHRAAPKDVRNARLRWDEVAVVVALLGGAALVVLAGRGARKTPRAWQFGRQEAVSAALDESLDDLRNDPDLRRAIVAAYARMEAALARAGLPRHPAEAPYEYLERALASLDASAGSVRRLTALYEWAKFSHHDPEPAMRDEAVGALVAVRDELRSPAADPVAV
jgi:Domain of unknown function (DUF4129)